MFGIKSKTPDISISREIELYLFMFGIKSKTPDISISREIEHYLFMFGIKSAKTCGQSPARQERTDHREAVLHFSGRTGLVATE